MVFLRVPYWVLYYFYCMSIILLVVYMNECKIELFADNTMLYLAGKNLDFMQNTINCELGKLFK